MSLDEIGNIENIVKKDGEVYFLMLEGREWDTIDIRGVKLMAKINNYRHYAERPESKKKCGKVKIALYSQFRPPEDIIKTYYLQSFL